jgi:hypothetical protein
MISSVENFDCRLADLPAVHDVRTEQTRRDLRSTYIPECPAQAEFGLSRIRVYVSSNVYVYKREISWNPNSNALEHDRPLN